jgi:hypothetical protein
MPAAQTATLKSNPPSYESVWATLKEVSEMHKEISERQKETDRIVQETARIVKENGEQQKKDEREMKASAKRLDEELGRLSKRFGETAEFLVMPNLLKKFRKMGYVFNKIYHRTDIEDIEHEIFAEVDITLENGEKVMIVEVKTKPNTLDIKDHVERMGKVRQYANLKGDKRAFLGAVDGFIISDNVKKFALKKGFYVIEPSGETFNITVPEGEYAVREW